jgi:lipopolysaccharide export system permease protein
VIAVKRVDRLIAGSALGAIALAWLLVVAIDVIMSFARELDEIDASYTLAVAAAHVLWTIPRRAYEWFTTAAVIGTLVGIGALAPTAEITAMRAGGMSKFRIALGALVAVGLLTLVVMAMGETVAPLGERRAQAVAAGAKSRDLIAAGRTGIWAREGTALINARRGQITAAGVELLEVRLYDFEPGGQLRAITLAERAVHDGAAWSLRKAARTEFRDQSAIQTALGDVPWEATLDPRLLTLSIVRPENMGIADLAATLAYLDRNGLDRTAFASALWARVFYPLNLLALVALALPFAFAMARTGGLGQRIFLGIVLAIAWYFGQKALLNLAGVYGLDYRLAQAVPLVLLIAIATARFRRAR